MTATFSFIVAGTDKFGALHSILGKLSWKVQGLTENKTNELLGQAAQRSSDCAEELSTSERYQHDASGNVCGSAAFMLTSCTSAQAAQLEAGAVTAVCKAAAQASQEPLRRASSCCRSVA